MGGRGYHNDVAGYLNGNRRTVEFFAVYKTPDGKIDFLKDKMSPQAPTMPIFSNTSYKIYVLVGKKGDLKSIGIYDDHHRLKKTIHLDHHEKGVGQPHVHDGDAFHHHSGDSRRPTAEEQKLIDSVYSFWKKGGR